MTSTKFMTPTAYDARREYLRQWQAYHLDPSRNSEPDHALLLIDAAHGPITSKTLIVDPRDGNIVVAVSYHGRAPRFLDPIDDLAVDLALACGIGMSVNDTRRRPLGLAYPRFRLPKPLGGALALIRALANAGPWQVVKQVGPDGLRHDYHSLRRRDLSTQSVRRVWEEGKKSRVPKRGRQHLLEAAELCWTRNHEKAGLTGSLEDQLAAIRSALTVGDERHAAYLFSLASNTP